MQKFKIKLTLLLLSIILVRCSSSSNSTPPLPTIFQIVENDERFSTLQAAVEAAGLDDALNGEGPFTVFAPTDEAIAALLTELSVTAEELLAREDLQDILLYHVVGARVPAANAIALAGSEDPTAETLLQGASITLEVIGDDLTITGPGLTGRTPPRARVTGTDINARNGIIHVIDRVLLPPADD